MGNVKGIRRVGVATFTASEVERITGVSGAMQRDWRRRELIEPRPGRGWKRLGADDLIQVLVMRLLSERNISPASARKFGRMAIRHTLLRLLAEAYPNEDVDLEFAPAGPLAPERMVVERRTQTPPDLAPYLIYAEHREPSGVQGVVLRLARSIEHFRDIAQKTGRSEIPKKLFVMVVVDLKDVFAEMIDRRIKPYFVEKDE